MNNIKKITLYLLLSVLYQPAYAVDKALDVTIDFKCLGWAASSRNAKLYYVTDNEPQLLKMNELFRSDKYDYTGGRNLSFYEKSADGKLKKISNVRINGKAKDWLFIFIKEGSDQYKVLGLEDGSKSYPGGSFRFYNISTRDMGLKLGDDVSVIKVKSMHRSVPKYTKHKMIPVELAEIVASSGKARFVYSNSWIQRKNIRRLTFIRDSMKTESGVVQLKVIEDYVIK